MKKDIISTFVGVTSLIIAAVTTSILGYKWHTLVTESSTLVLISLMVFLGVFILAAITLNFLEEGYYLLRDFNSMEEAPDIGMPEMHTNYMITNLTKEQLFNMYWLLIGGGYLSEKTTEEEFISIFSEEEIDSEARLCWKKSSISLSTFLFFLNESNILKKYSKKKWWTLDMILRDGNGDDINLTTVRKASCASAVKRNCDPDDAFALGYIISEISKTKEE